MSKGELESIVDRVEEYLAENGEALTFSGAAKAELARVAGGYPWFVHLIGQETLILVDREGFRFVDKNHVETAIESLPKKRLAKQFNDRYLLAVRDSSHREYVLRLFAEWRDEDIPTSDIYPKAKLLGVTGPSTYLGHLTQQQCGYILVRSPNARLYRFKDEMFKVYVRMRHSVYVGVDKEVRRALKS